MCWAISSEIHHQDNRFVRHSIISSEFLMNENHMPCLQILPDPSEYNPKLVCIATLQPTREVGAAGGYNIYAQKRERKLRTPSVRCNMIGRAVQSIRGLSWTLKGPAVRLTRFCCRQAGSKGIPISWQLASLGLPAQSCSEHTHSTDRTNWSFGMLVRFRNLIMPVSGLAGTCVTREDPMDKQERRSD